MKILLSQVNNNVGDLAGNHLGAVKSIKKAIQRAAEMVVFPELFIPGYPPKDIVYNRSFIEENKKILYKIASQAGKIAIIIGFIDTDNRGNLYNAAAYIRNGKIVGVDHKTFLPNYDVFDEQRYFLSSDEKKVFKFQNIKFGITICEDIWRNGPVEKHVKNGVDFIINISASPYTVSKFKERLTTIGGRARKNSVPIIYCNAVGAQDDIIFDGNSCVFNHKGQLVYKAQSFKEDYLLLDLSKVKILKPLRQKTCIQEDIFSALTLGIRDYAEKNGFNKIILGLSGGVDSAVVAVLATFALGKKNVLALYMPSMFNLEKSFRDSQKLANNLGIEYKMVPIGDIYDDFIEIFKRMFAGRRNDKTEENIQARIRGNILMSFSNKFNFLVLVTGNKSEIATGYFTLYGDAAGGLSPISDLYKTAVYDLANYINTNFGDVIPPSIISKEPSAELRIGQTDSDDLPDYGILDRILGMYIEGGKTKREIVKEGYNKILVDKIIRMVRGSEYKRYQLPIGLKVTNKAFGFGRRIPVTHFLKY